MSFAGERPAPRRAGRLLVLGRLEHVARGLGPDASAAEALEERFVDRFVADEPMLAALAAASVQGVVATGRRRGCFVGAGLEKVAGSASLFALTYNILRLITLGG